MSKTRYINTKFWSDPWIVDRLNPLDRHLFFYFLTNEHTTIAGIYEISLRTISYEIGIEREELLRMLKRLEPKIRYLSGWVIITNAIKNQNYHSPKIKTGIEMALDRCPDNLLHYVNWPKDWQMPESIAKRVNLQGSLDLATYGMDTISHSNTNTKSKSNTKAAKPRGDVDKKLAAKEQAAKNRKGNGYESFASAGEILKKKSTKRG